MNLARLAHLLTRHRWPVIGAWFAMTLFGAFAVGQVSNRWLQSFSVPGKPAYEASQRTLLAFGAGARGPWGAQTRSARGVSRAGAPV